MPRNTKIAHGSFNFQVITNSRVFSSITVPNFFLPKFSVFFCLKQLENCVHTLTVQLSSMFKGQKAALVRSPIQKTTEQTTETMPPSPKTITAARAVFN